MKCPPPSSKHKLHLKLCTAATAAPALSPPKLHVSCKGNQSDVDKLATKWTKTAAGKKEQRATRPLLSALPVLPLPPTVSVLPTAAADSESLSKPSGLPSHQPSAPSTTVADVDYPMGISNQSSGPLTAADGLVVSTTIAAGHVHQDNGSSTIGPDHVGNVSNIGDWDLCNKSPDHIELDATVNLFVSKDRPTSLNIDESAIMSVQLPYEEKLASVLTGVARCYSPVQNTQNA
ncbi:hypothetical protein CVT25_012659 [Psilocybe cyanescens]|uniref:Uncharacterized protein n=1 Tax=Psilocybe cyanescens TaxID=93625 RepID=A0A409X4D9_PSICY|nr:hypothetical protein CVT25_012659 [Psilocybe cyanescens]